MKLVLIGALASVAACSGTSDPPVDATPTTTKPPPGEFARVLENLPGGLMNVWGTSASDVFVVGADPGPGPGVYHYDGEAWTRLKTGTSGDLWWTYGFKGGPVFMGGANGTILKYEAGTFTKLPTPGSDVVFGIWGASPTDLWAVGGRQTGGGAFAWRWDGSAWTPAQGLPADTAGAIFFKVWGCSPSDVWIVGAADPNVTSTTEGLCVHWDGAAFTHASCAIAQRLLTVHSACTSSPALYEAVGGSATAACAVNAGGVWAKERCDDAPQLMGVCLTATGGWATSAYGDVYYRGSHGWEYVEPTVDSSQPLHACWVDPDGGLWAAGGDVFSPPMINGVLIYRGAKAPSGEVKE